MKYAGKIWGCGIIAAVTILIGGACAKKPADEPNVLKFPSDSITELNIFYDEEEITFYKSSDETITVKEFMTDCDKRYFASVKQQGNSLQISEGKKPLFKSGFHRYVEVYLPDSYSGSLGVTTTDGDINLSRTVQDLESLRIDSTSGTVTISGASAPSIYLSTTRGTLKLGKIRGGQIRLETTSGELKCSKMEGTISYTTTSGTAVIKSAAGSGVYRAENSGQRYVSYEKVDGDLSFYNKNDKIELLLPRGLEYELRAVTKNGTVKAPLSDGMLVEKGRIEGDVGDRPTVKIELESKNGDIRVEQ